MSVIYSHISLVYFVITIRDACDYDSQADHQHRRDDLTLDITPGGAAHCLETDTFIEEKKKMKKFTSRSGIFSRESLKFLSFGSSSGFSRNRS